jgi:peroxiredoxin
LGVKIVGVSFDPPAKNAKFIEAESFKFPLWTDSKRELALYWGAATSASQFFANRVTVVLDEQGRWRLFYSSSAIGFDMYGHPGVVLEDVKALLSCTP